MLVDTGAIVGDYDLRIYGIQQDAMGIIADLADPVDGVVDEVDEDGKNTDCLLVTAEAWAGRRCGAAPVERWKSKPSVSC